MTLDEAIIHTQEASRREDHPECYQCKNRKNKIICRGCTRNNFAPTGCNKQDCFDEIIFEEVR